MKNKIFLLLFSSNLMCTMNAQAEDCAEALATLPEQSRAMLSSNSPTDFSKNLFLETYERAISNLEQPDLDQLVLSPFDLRHPSSSVRHNESKLLKLLGLRLNEIYPADSADLHSILERIQISISNAIEKQRAEASLRKLSIRKNETLRSAASIIGKPLKGKFNNMLLSPSGRYVAAVSTQGIIQIFDISTSSQIAIFSHSDVKGIDAIQFSPDSRSIAFGRRQAGLSLWEFFTKKEASNH